MLAFALFFFWAVKLALLRWALGLGLLLVLLAALRGTAAIPRRLRLWVLLLSFAFGMLRGIVFGMHQHPAYRLVAPYTSATPIYSSALSIDTYKISVDT